jgi:Na+/melibiose symporter-like transporter
MHVSATPVDLRTKLFYGFGSIAYGVKDNGFRALLLIYYNQVVGLPANMVAGAIMIALVIDSVFDPIIGQISDNWHSRWGRRHPFMYAAAIPSALSFLLLWNPPTDWSQMQLLAYLVVTAVIVRTFITLYEIPSAALVSELSSNYDERTSLMSFRYLFFFWGSLAISLITYRVLMVTDATHPIGQLNPASYTRYGWVAATMILLAILISARGTHHWIPRLRAPPPKNNKSWWATLKEMYDTLAHRSFLTVLGAGLCKGMALGISGSLALYLNTFFWQLTASQLAILVLDGFFTAALAAWITPRISKRIGKKTTIIWFLALSFVIGVSPQLLRLAGLYFTNDSPWLVPALFVNGIVFGTFGIGSTILSSAMIADVVEDSELRTGRRSEGLFFSASSLIQKAISGVGVMGSGLILALVAFPQKAKPGHVDQVTLDHLVFASVAVMGALYAVGVLCVCFYRIDRSTHEANLKQLSITTVEPESVAATLP